MCKKDREMSDVNKLSRRLSKFDRLLILLYDVAMSNVLREQLQALFKHRNYLKNSLKTKNDIELDMEVG